MKKIFLILIAAGFLGCSEDNTTPAPVSKWISSVLEYNPAPGQFINTSIGSQASTADIVGKRGMVTLGGFGGYIVFKFEKPVKNGFGIDFVIHGNAFEGSSEPGAVMVSLDANGNGIADDVWYEIAGSAYEKSVKDYQITYQKPADLSIAAAVAWTDNKGASGVLGVIDIHTQSYWPQWISSNIFVGNRVENKPKIVNNLWVLAALDRGYADNFSEDYMEVVNNDNDTKMSNKFDLSNATVPLEKADFIKVYNCQNEQAGIVGELSTEVCGAIIINY